MCAFCEREIHMHLLEEFCAKLFYNLGSLSPNSCLYVEYPRVLDAFPQLTVRSEWEFLKHRGTLILWRCSFTFFTVLNNWLVQSWSLFIAEGFSLWLQLCFLVNANSPEKVIRWCQLVVFCFLSFCLVLWVGISGVLGQRCLLVLVKTNLQTPCLSTLNTLYALYLVLCLTPARRSWLILFPELAFSKFVIISKCTKVP